jgi:integrase/recombinase XerD
MVQVIKQHPFYGWNAEEKYWTLPEAKKTINTLKAYCEEVKWKFVIKEGEIYQPRLPRQGGTKTKVRLECPREYLDKLRMLRYSENTISVYRSCFTEFINYYPDKKIEEITYDEICAYELYLVESKRVSISYQNQAINSIKFFFEKILKGQRETYYIERPRQEKRLPTVLSIEEVKAIINSIENLKHKCAIMTTYSAGLRTGELLNLKVGDIDSKRMLIIVRRGKGKKDRITLLSPTLLEILRIYFKQYHPKDCKSSAKSLPVKV